MVVKAYNYPEYCEFDKVFSEGFEEVTQEVFNKLSSVINKINNYCLEEHYFQYVLVEQSDCDDVFKNAAEFLKKQDLILQKKKAAEEEKQKKKLQTSILRKKNRLKKELTALGFDDTVIEERLKNLENEISTKKKI